MDNESSAFPKNFYVRHHSTPNLFNSRSCLKCFSGSYLDGERDERKRESVSSIKEKKDTRAIVFILLLVRTICVCEAECVFEIFGVSYRIESAGVNMYFRCVRVCVVLVRSYVFELH